MVSGDLHELDLDGLKKINGEFLTELQLEQLFNNPLIEWFENSDCVGAILKEGFCQYTIWDVTLIGDIYIEVYVKNK